MKKILKPVLFVLLGVIIAPFIKPMLSKIPLIGPMLDKVGGSSNINPSTGKPF